MNDKIQQQIEGHMAEILKLLEIPMNNSTEGTAKRVAKMWCNETLANRNDANIDSVLTPKMKVFDNVNDLHDLVIVKDIPFYSTCEHHLMPFFGKITVGYVPRHHILGLSKIPRAVEYFSKKPQLQERLVQEIAQYLNDVVNPYEIYVIARDTIHTCVLCRGVESECDTDTIYSIGDNKYRTEFFERIRR